MARLDSLPPALFRDEAEKAYTAWSLLRTGRTLDGAHLPLFVNVFGVTTSAIYQFCAVPFIWMFGPNEWGARLPAAVAGTLTILMNYLYMRRERGRDAAVWASSVPRHVAMAHHLQPLGAAGYLRPAVRGFGHVGVARISRRQKWGLPVAGACFGMAIYSYDVAKLFVPLLLLWIALLYAKDLARRWKETLIGALAFAAIVAPVVRLSLSAPDAAQARFNAISILQPGIGPAAVIGEFLRNYFLHFSPQFLLLFGDGELRHSAGVGMLTVVEFACAILWAHYAWKRRWKREDLVWLGWLLLSPVAASLTRVGIPHALRMIVVIPVIQNMAGDSPVAVDQPPHRHLRRRHPADGDPRHHHRVRAVRMRILHHVHGEVGRELAVRGEAGAGTVGARHGQYRHGACSTRSPAPEYLVCYYAKIRPSR